MEKLIFLFLILGIGLGISSCSLDTAVRNRPVAPVAKPQEVQLCSHRVRVMAEHDDFRNKSIVRVNISSLDQNLKHGDERVVEELPCDGAYLKQVAALDSKLSCALLNEKQDSAGNVIDSVVQCDPVELEVSIELVKPEGFQPDLNLEDFNLKGTALPEKRLLSPLLIDQKNAIFQNLNYSAKLDIEIEQDMTGVHCKFLDKSNPDQPLEFPLIMKRNYDLQLKCGPSLHSIAGVVFFNPELPESHQDFQLKVELGSRTIERSVNTTGSERKFIFENIPHGTDFSLWTWGEGLPTGYVCGPSGEAIDQVLTESVSDISFSCIIPNR